MHPFLADLFSASYPELLIVPGNGTQSDRNLLSKPNNAVQGLTSCYPHPRTSARRRGGTSSGYAVSVRQMVTCHLPQLGALRWGHGVFAPVQGGGGPRTSSEQGFLDALAAYITDWAAPGISARFFEMVARMHPLVVMAEVPDAEVPATTCTLQVGYWDVRQGCRALQGEWG